MGFQNFQWKILVLCLNLHMRWHYLPLNILLNSGDIMTIDEIIDMFDSTNITLGELSVISGKSVKELKNILMGE